MQNELENIIKYRIAQAYNTINEVELLIEQNLLTIAINRIYYGMFYMLLALSLQKGFKTSKHSQLLGWFTKEYMRTEIIDRNIGKIVYNAFEDRNDSDYGAFITFEKSDVIEKSQDMKLFISEVEKLILLK